MRIGPERQPFEQQLSLSDWAQETGNGIIGYQSPEDLPEEMYDFINSQFMRFNIPVLKDGKLFRDITGWGAYASFYYVDAINPYALLTSGISDVDWSDLGHTHTIDIINNYRNTTKEADPSKLEVFTQVDGQSENFFNYAMSHPGLEALPMNMGKEIEWILFDYYGGPEDCCNGEALAALQELCVVDGVFQKRRYQAYFELAAWAAFVFMAGPPGRDWRVANHDVFWLCHTEGIAVLYDFSFIPREHYEIHERNPQSCCICGLDSYCVELVYMEGVNRFMCEKHLNGDTPLYSGATCGTKICKYVNCKNHPAHGEYNAQTTILRGSGQMFKMGGQDDRIAIGGGSAQKLIVNK